MGYRPRGGGGHGLGVVSAPRREGGGHTLDPDMYIVPTYTFYPTTTDSRHSRPSARSDLDRAAFVRRAADRTPDRKNEAFLACMNPWVVWTLARRGGKHNRK